MFWLTTAGIILGVFAVGLIIICLVHLLIHLWFTL